MINTIIVIPPAVHRRGEWAAVSRAQQSYSYGHFDEALQDINRAYELSPQPNYLYQKGIILFAQDKYVEAYDLYQSLFDSSVRSADLFFMAS